jgi:hypothetical protein
MSSPQDDHDVTALADLQELGVFEVLHFDADLPDQVVREGELSQPITLSWIVETDTSKLRAASPDLRHAFAATSLELGLLEQGFPFVVPVLPRIPGTGSYRIEPFPVGGEIRLGYQLAARLRRVTGLLVGLEVRLHARPA